MITHGTFFLPGPTEVRPEILAAMQQPMIAHRSPAMREIMRRIHERARPAFGTARPVYVVTGSGTSAMEMGIRGGSRQRVLAVVTGAFGERWARIAEACGRDVTRLVMAEGEPADPEVVRHALGHADYDAVTMVESESSTGALSDVAAVARVVREQSEALLLVDGVTSVGAKAEAMDRWGADWLLTASQKALALPPGLALAAGSERLLERARALPDRGMYLDVVRYDEFWQKDESPFTPAISLIHALDRQLAEITGHETWEARWARHLAMARTVWEWTDAMAGRGIPVELVAPAGARSPSVSAIRYAGDVRAVLDAMRERGFILGGGYGALAGSSFRIGHMGDHTVAGVERMLDALTDVLFDAARAG